MTEQETVMLIETEQRSKSNAHRLDNMELELKEIQSEQKAIYKIATSVELITQRVSNIEDKVALVVEQQVGRDRLAVLIMLKVTPSTP